MFPFPSIEIEYANPWLMVNRLSSSEYSQLKALLSAMTMPPWRPPWRKVKSSKKYDLNSSFLTTFHFPSICCSTFATTAVGIGVGDSLGVGD